MARLYREFIDRKKFIPQTEFIHAWRGSTERHPWRLGSRQPTRPATDRFRARQPRSEEGRAGAGRGAALARSRAWLGSTEDSSTGENSFPGRIHPRMAWIYRAPSMALAPPRNPPARPRTGSVRASHGVKKERQERVAALRLLGAEHGSALQGIHRPKNFLSRMNSSTHGVDLPDAPGECRRRGGVRLRGREPHGCGDRAYRDVLAASPAISPLPANPSTQLLPLLRLLLQRVQGRRPCTTKTPY